MNVRRPLLCAAALLGLVACSDKDKDKDSTGSGATTTATTTVTTSSGPNVLVPEGPATKPGIEARVKAEVDGRADGIKGTAWAVTGAKASLQSPAGWQTSKGAVTVAASPDKKAQLAAAAFGTEGASGKLPAAVPALGLTSCEWNPPEAITIGAGKLAGAAADGLCLRGTAPVRAAYVAPQAEALLVVGAWDADGDSASVFGAMRAITKAAGGTGDGGIAACCAALRGNAPSAPPDQQAGMLFAAGVCDGLRNSPQGAAALAQVRAALRGAKIPSSCR